MREPPAIRSIAPEEHRTFAEVFLATLGETLDEEDFEAQALGVELDRTLAVEDEGRIVATTRGISFRLTLPGGAQAPVVGVTAVGVLPTHRRRGLASALMARLLDDAVERGEVGAVLLASEASIYGRFGFGPAAWLARRLIDTARVRLRPAPADPGRARLVDRAEALRVLPEVYERAAGGRAGLLSRDEHRWERTLADRPSSRHGAGPLQMLVHEDADGRPDGYSLYRIKPAWIDDMVPDHEAALEESLCLSPAVEVSLWRHLLSLDLVRRVRAEALAVDDPLPLLVHDLRAVRLTGLVDLLWLCPLDVPALLSARRYAEAGRLSLQVLHPFRPASGGRFALEVDDAGAAQCRPTTDEPDLTLDAADLGSVLLGSTALVDLARAGRVEERAAGACRQADAMLRARAPWCTTYF